MWMWQLMTQVTLELPSQHGLKVPDSFRVPGTKKLTPSCCQGHHGLRWQQESALGNQVCSQSCCVQQKGICWRGTRDPVTTRQVKASPLTRTTLCPAPSILVVSWFCPLVPSVICPLSLSHILDLQLFPEIQLTHSAHKPMLNVMRNIGNDSTAQKTQESKGLRRNRPLMKALNPFLSYGCITPTTEFWLPYSKYQATLLHSHSENIPGPNLCCHTAPRQNWTWAATARSRVSLSKAH